MSFKPVIAAALLCACTPAEGPSDDSEVGSAESISVVGFNVESGDAYDDDIAALIATVQGEGLWGITETMNGYWPPKFAEAAGDEGLAFDWVMGTTSFDDLVTILWDTEKYELLSYEELHDINVGGTARAPLVGHFRSRETGREFLFMANHLWRTNDTYRHQQGGLLNEWARTQTLPVIAVGDYNFDWRVNGGEESHDLGYDRMVADDVWRWVRPETLVGTQCSNFAPAVLDFVFVAGEAKDWAASSAVLEPQTEYCPDDNRTSDHRPVRADFELPS